MPSKEKGAESIPKSLFAVIDVWRLQENSSVVEIAASMSQRPES
jgi:hypothetical protein